VRLSWKDWVLVAIIFTGILYFFPLFWMSLEKINHPPDYRFPYQLSDDYWMFTRWSKFACSNYPALIIGDSFIWGHYVTMDKTLSHYLNELERENIFANMGVDGLHPAAITGLLKYYGKDISNKRVILHLNPLWMSSKRHDLSGEEELRFNHPRLIPQLRPNLACYRPSPTQIIDVVVERNFSFFGWLNHIRNVYFENMDMQNWMIQNPYKNPFDVITFETPVPENKPRSKPIPWHKRGIKTQNLPWMSADDSFQWSSFKQVLEILIERDNKIYVILGPFNPYILTDESSHRFQSMKNEMEKWFEENKLYFYSVPDLPSDYYADGSHPLEEGYKKIAVDLFKTESFNKWMKNY